MSILGEFKYFALHLCNILVCWLAILVTHRFLYRFLTRPQSLLDHEHKIVAMNRDRETPFTCLWNLCLRLTRPGGPFHFFPHSPDSSNTLANLKFSASLPSELADY